MWYYGIVRKEQKMSEEDAKEIEARRGSSQQ